MESIKQSPPSTSHCNTVLQKTEHHEQPTVRQLTPLRPMKQPPPHV